jgi:hypothetical protein
MFICGVKDKDNKNESTRKPLRHPISEKDSNSRYSRPSLQRINTEGRVFVIAEARYEQVMGNSRKYTI